MLNQRPVNYESNILLLDHCSNYRPWE